MEANLISLTQTAALAPAQFLVAGIWQGLLLTAVAWVGLKAFPRISPTNRFILWLNVFVLAAVLPFFAVFRAPAPVPLSNATATAISVPHLPASWAVALVGLWGLTSLLALARLVWNGYSLWLLSRTAIPIKQEALDPELRSILAKASSRSLEISLSSRVDSPAVIGFFHRVIVIPEWLSKRLTQPELKQVLIHELAHLKRHDDWTNLLQRAFRALFPLNPALIFADRQLCREREMACDDAVLNAAIAPRVYATCLATLAEKRILQRTESLAPGAWKRRSELAERVHRILTNNRKLGSLSASPIMGVFLLAFLSVGIGVARCPNLVAFTATGTSSPMPIEAPISPPAKFEQASYRIVSPAQEHVIRHRVPRRALKHRAASSDTVFEIEAVDFLPRMSDAANSPIVLTLWESSTPSVTFAGGDLGPSVSEVSILQSRMSWVVIQL